MWLRQKTGWIGVDLGGSSVKLAQLVWREGRLVIGSSAMASRTKAWLPEGGARQVSLAPASSHAELQEAALLGQSWQGKSAAAAVSMAVCDSYQSPFPTEVTDHTLPDQEFQKSALYPLQLRQVGWWPVSVHTKMPPHALVVTLPKSWSERISTDLGQQRWSCRAIDVLPWCFSRAVGLMQADGKPALAPQGLQAVIDWGYCKATCVLLRDGIPIMVRTLKDAGYSNLFDAVSSELGTTPLETRQLLHSSTVASGNSTNSPAEQVVRRIVDPLLKRFDRELLRTFEYWSSQTRGEVIERTTLFGGGCALGGIAGRIAQLTNVPAEEWTFPRAKDNGAGIPAFMFGAALGMSALAWEQS
ncbi:type IV pilus biogenesis protein PilM [Adhaeretor mobilis]|uniref:Competence protein A n=1 Tax=Adhaeretor mobilis TaxID=1930276 RepID=A0A517MVX2_9BACT|nr:hypothetical protein [Adhaeretor mobilis]QDS98947.1 Competence protein A [Adhaeretor mobilis]